MTRVRKYTYVFMVVHFCLLLPYSLSAQIEYPGVPVSKDYRKVLFNDFVELPSAVFLAEDYQLRKDRDEMTKAGVFASVLEIKLEPAKEDDWEQYADGRYIWRKGFTSENASSLALSFNPFKLNPGTRIFVYTPDGDDCLGAFSFRNNKETGVLSLASLPGDSLILEIQSIYGPETLGELKIESLSVGFPHPENIPGLKDGYYGWSAECELDVNCLDIKRYQLQKLSVCRLVTIDGDVKRRCTGTLINNTSEDGKPYVITARHCVSNDDAAARTVFSFDYESPYCNGPDGELKSISGAYLRSKGEQMDYVLLELSKQPPVDYTPVYAGWNAESANPLGTYIIHHPEGDVKKISYDVDEATVGSFLFYKKETFWEVKSYEEGTTENGSSGGGLFNSRNQLIGTLSGGGTVCSSPIEDFYQQFAAAWEPSEQTDEQLKFWLDPRGTGKTELANLEIYAGLSSSMSNISDSSSIGLIALESGWGYVSGHNSLGSYKFAEYFSHAGTKYVYALNLKVARASFQSSIAAKSLNNTGARVLLKIWDTGDTPENLLFSKEVFPYELEAGTYNYIRMDTLIKVNEGFYAGYEVFYDDPLDTFALFTGTPIDNPSAHAAMMNTGSGWQALSNGEQSLNLSLAISPSVLDYYPQPSIGTEEFPEEEITLYPNPAGDYIQILFKDQPESDVSITVYDLYGNFILKQSYSPTPANIQFDINRISGKGMYLLKVEFGDHRITKKFVKL